MKITLHYKGHCNKGRRVALCVILSIMICRVNRRHDNGKHDNMALQDVFIITCYYQRESLIVMIQKVHLIFGRNNVQLVRISL